MLQINYNLSMDTKNKQKDSLNINKLKKGKDPVVKLYNGLKKLQIKQDPIVKLRKVIKIHNSYYISIPPDFIKRHNIRVGERLPVLAASIMKVIPMKE